MESRSSVSARVRQRVDLFGKRQYVGSGTYQEQQSDSGRLFRVELKIKLEDDASTSLEVFDGRYLWTYRKLGSETLSQVDVGRVAKTLKEKNRLPQPGQIGTWPGLGGLPRLLRGLNAAFDFSGVEDAAFTIADQVPAQELPVWRLSGSWKPERLAKLLPDSAEDIKQGNPVNLEKLPLHLPAQVVVSLGKDDLFPYQIDYRRPAAKQFWNRGGSEGRSILMIEFPEVELNVPVEASQFTYKPGNLAPTDRTAAFLKSLEGKVK
jgi:hypothetical protein